MAIKNAKATKEDVLTKNGEANLVDINISACNQREKQLEFNEKLIEIEELRRSGVPDIPARVASQNLRKKLRVQANV